MRSAALATQKPALPQPFQSPEHEPFIWHGGDSAVLLVHGFPGTPAEMRPLARHLHNRGWTAQGILLPGFGPEMQHLGEYSHEDWLQAVTSAAEGLCDRYQRVAVIGNSMGAMLALRSALIVPVDALVLISPFWRVEQRWLDMLFPILQPLLGNLRPFRKADFSDSTFRTNLRQVLGTDTDLDSQAVQAAVRELPLPTVALANVRALGHAAYAVTHDVRPPVCIVQGNTDPVAASRLTQLLARRLPSLQGLIEVSGDHDLVRGTLCEDSLGAQLVHTFLTHATPH